MPTSESFPPIVRDDARVLVLGSMPGVRSLREARYYAHPQNAFWWIAGELFGSDPELPYAERTRRLQEHHVALWDVLKHCERPGSLDTSILRESEVPNDLAGLLRAAPRIGAVFFNGAKAEQAWRRHVASKVANELGDRDLRLERLPSTSPALAMLTRDQKLSAWRSVARAVERGR